jgi:hypothetical protein
VANFISNTVQKVPVSTGVPGPPIGVGKFPSALAFDGSNIWVANLGDSTVQKIPVATGVPGPVIHVGFSPDALVFDGTNIWVANEGDTTVQTIPVATSVAGPPIPAGHFPAALAFDGANMWVANLGDANVQREGFVSTEFYLPVVGRVAGQGGLQAYTTIWATNLSSSSTRHFTFRFLKQGQASTSPASFTDALAPGETKIYENVIEEKLNLSSGIGAGRITADGEIFASERIYNQAHPADNLGTTEGLFFAGVPAPLSIGLGEKASIQGVNQGDPSEDMRYNFALVETSGYAATVHVALVNSSGATLGAADFPLQPYEQIQPNVTAVFPAVSTINARLVASVTAGAGKVILAGAQVANTSLDGTGFEMSFKEPPAINVGNGPRALAFDGASVWVANEGDGTVQKIPVATGVPGPPIAVGGEPVALAFDGASVWFANFDDRTVQKIPISTGVPGPPIGVGASPLALVFDGASIWVACGNTVRKIPVATGVPGPAINLGASPDALTFDGTNIWVAILDNTVRKIPIATGIPGPPISVGAFPRALAFDGASIWVANQNGNTVQKIPVATGVAGSAIGVGSAPFALAFDGANMWVANKDDNTVRLIPIATGVPGPPIGVGIDPVGLVFDGVNMWVATEGDGTVQKR